MIANPPYGKDWKRDEDAVEAEAERGTAGRFGAGTPRISDGQLLFLQHMVPHMKPPEDGGSRIAIIMNGSPLFTGDAGSGESEIRRWILENDWLEAIIALPEQLFYNTGIATYVWVLTNRKPAERRGKVQLIDATAFWAPCGRASATSAARSPRAPGGDPRPVPRLRGGGERSKVFPTEHFGYRKIRVERPLRLNFQASASGSLVSTTSARSRTSPRAGRGTRRRSGRRPRRGGRAGGDPRLLRACPTRSSRTGRSS